MDSNAGQEDTATENCAHLVGQALIICKTHDRQLGILGWVSNSLVLVPSSCRVAAQRSVNRGGQPKRDFKGVPHLAFQAAACGSALLFAAPFLSDSPTLLERGVDAFSNLYLRAPALVVALAALLVVPLVAGLSAMIWRASRAKKRAAALESVRLAAEHATTANSAESATLPGLAQQARLAVQGVDNGGVPLARPMIRIGRNKDNDICLSDRSVHRYHAVVERSSEAVFVITDLSGTQGNGIRINGERTTKAQLRDGDVIELGRATLKFENAPM